MSTVAAGYNTNNDKKLAFKMMGLIGVGLLIVGAAAGLFMVFVWKTSVGYGYSDFDTTVPKAPTQEPKKSFYCDPAYPTKWIGCQ